MEKNKPFRELLYRSLRKTLLIMRIAIVLMILGVLQAGANEAYSQKTRLSLNFSDVALIKVLDKIEAESEYFFLYNEKLLDTERKITITAQDQLVDVILGNIFTGTDVKYTIIDRKIILAPNFLSDDANLNKTFQQKTITGKVTDSKGATLPGVNVRLAGTMVGAITDIDGKYTINAPDGNGTLAFSFIGYASKEISVNGSSTIDITLIEESLTLNEVVITALGIKRDKKALAYAVTEVGGENLTKSRVINLGTALAGRVAGVTASGTAGGPGSSSRIVIRGNGSLGGDNQPLIVVNGIPITNSNQTHTTPLVSTLDRGNGLSSINPDDIESISVLKGGASAALYGSRAANGVILITTKSGKAQKGIGVELNSTYTVETPSLIPDWQYAYGSGTRGLAPTSQAEAIANGRVSWGAKMDGSSVIQFDGVSRPYVAQKDNMKNFYDIGKTFSNTLALIGGNETANFRFSASNIDVSGIVPNNELNHKTFSLSANATLAKKIVFEGSAQYSIETGTNRTSTNNVSNNPTSSVALLATSVDVRSLAPGYDSRGYETEWNDYVYTTNPYFAINKLKNGDENRRFIGSSSVRYNIADFLYARARVGIDASNFQAFEIVPNGIQYNVRGAMSNDRNLNYETNSELLLGFDKKFGFISVNAILGGNKMYRQFNGVTLTSGLFNVPGNYFISNGSSPIFNENYSASAINSIFGSADIGYNDYLYLTLTGRKDWFSTLSIDKNSLFYPSVGLSFVISNAWKSKPAWLSYSKIRGSYAQVGGGAPNPYGIDLAYTAGTATHFGQSLMSISSSTIPAKLEPYTSTTAELGLDLRVFESRLAADITVYDRVTTNDIVSASVAPSSSYSSARLNVGSMSNRGLELMLTGSPLLLSNFSWDLGVNMAYNVNKVIKIADGLTTLSTGASTRSGNGYVFSYEGQPFGMVSGFKFKQDANGNTIFNKVTGFPIKSAFGPIGRGVPPLTLGLSNNFGYKNFSFGFLIDGRFGSVMYSATNDYAVFYGKDMRTIENNVREDGITVTGVDETGAPFTKTFTAQNWYQGLSLNYTDPFVSKNGFVKLRSLTFGYSLPQTILSRTPFQYVSLSLVARDLLLLYSQIPNIDPESQNSNGNGQGIEGQGLPLTRSIGLNLMVRF